ncbi:aryl-sulfate sulfotransferase [Spirosoma sp.]|uniref:aryl-sulfate sulfotransferase n=1 Tax=Spirosoma sp. TaxID=1899569 RepID=UPI003B3B1837
MKKILLLFFCWLLIITRGFSEISATGKAVIRKTVRSNDVTREFLGVNHQVNVNAPKVNTVPNLTATVIINDLNFNSGSVGASRDFVVTINEINNVGTQGTITFRVFKPSAFSITYATSNGNSAVYPGVANNNGDWNFAETDNYITVTSKSGIVVGANLNKAIGFSISRKAGIPTNTKQNITVSVVANSGGEQDATDNLAGITVNASETVSNLAFSSVQVNPYGYTPLSASLNFSASISGKAFIRVRGKHGKLTYVEKTFNDEGLQHSIPLIGLYANYTNAIDIRVVSASGDTLAKNTIAVQTAALSPDIPLPTSITTTSFNEANVTPGLLLVSSFSNIGTGKPSTPYFLDAYGEIRWLLDFRSHPQLSGLSYDDGINRLNNGNFFFGSTTTSIIYEVNLLGQVLNTWAMPGHVFHHEVYEKPNGNFLVTTSKPGSTYKDGVSSTTEDFVIEIDRQNNTILTVWDLKESLDETRNNLTSIDGAQTADDWFHGNAVIDDPTDNTIIVSGRTQGVVKLDYNNRVKWIMAPHAGWTTNRRGEDLHQFLLKPLDASGSVISNTAVIAGTAISPDFEWNWYQHNITHLPNGNWMMFDNGTLREYTPSTARYSRALSYKIDPVNMTIQQVWAYGKERDAETYSQIVSSAQFLPQTNHVVFGPGYRVQNANGLGGKIVEIDYVTKQVVSEISISSANQWGFHRAKKMSAYP